MSAGMRPLPPELDTPAWLHGETAFTTARTQAGEVLDWPAHLQRLRGTCAFLGLPEPEPALPALEPLPWGLLRVTVAGGGTFFSHRPLNPGPRPELGMTVRVTGIQVHPQLAAHKTGNYLPYRRAALAASPDHEGWLLDGHGNVVDGSRTSPLLELGGQRVVPAGGLPGLTRAAFLAGQEVLERPVHVSELARVTRAWVCGSGVGVVPVRVIRGVGLDLALPCAWPDTPDSRLVWPFIPS